MSQAGGKSPASSEKDVACKLCPWEEARLLAQWTTWGRPKPFLEAQRRGTWLSTWHGSAQDRGSLGSGQSILDAGWPGVAPYGFCLSPFQSSTPLLEPRLEA
jgi:hypothetical protein